MRVSVLFALVISGLVSPSLSFAESGLWKWTPMREGLPDVLSKGAELVSAESGKVTGLALGGLVGDVFFLRLGKTIIKCEELYQATNKKASRPAEQACYTLSK